MLTKKLKTEYIIKNLQERILSSGGIIDEDGVTTYPRTRGGVQYIGRDFRRTIKIFKPIKSLEALTQATKLIIFKPMQDDVLGKEHFDEYKKVVGLEYVELNRNHNFTYLPDRQNLIEKIDKFLKS